MKKKILIMVIISALTAGLALVYWCWSHNNDQQEQRELYGNIDIREVDLGFGVNGPIAQVLVEEGDRVKAGQTLAILEQDPFLYAVQAAEATLKFAEARMTEGIHGPRPQEIERARAAVQAAEATLSNASLIHSRRQHLADEQAASEEVASTTKADRIVAEANLKKAREDLALLLEGTRHEQKQQQLAEFEAQRAD
ncbi:MAG: biotin/lipoyl-binding protein, partial [Methylomonas lenta]|nr:biotin/lipoyl-binding protein [Methylomonas lenta]